MTNFGHTKSEMMWEWCELKIFIKIERSETINKTLVRQQKII